MMVISGIWMANNYCTTVLLGTIRGAGAAGVYNVVQSGAQLIVLLLAAANLPLAPVIAQMHARDEHGQLEQTVERVAQATLVASAPIALGLVFVPQLYLNLFGRGFGAGGTSADDSCARPTCPTQSPVRRAMCS